MVNSNQKWKYGISFGTMADIAHEIKYARNYLFQQKEYLSDEERAVVESLLSHYVVIEGNLRELIRLQ